MKNHFIYAYVGNKRTEVELIYEKIKNILEDKTTIIEPYCGSCAISFYIWKYHNKDYTFILNDDSEHLIGIMKVIKEGDIDTFLNEINNICFDEEDKFISKEKYTEIINNPNIDPLKIDFIKSKYYNLRKGLYPNKKMTKAKTENYKELYEFLKSPNVIINYGEAIEIINKYVDDEKTIIINDPPYIDTDNSGYCYNTEKKKTNIYKESMINERFYNSKCAFVIILESMWLIDILYSNWFLYRYQKKYNGYSKKTVEHMIISNKDFN